MGRARLKCRRKGCDHCWVCYRFGGCREWKAATAAHKVKRTG